MGLNLVVKAIYPEPTETLFEKARNFADMMEVSRPVSIYDGLPAQLMQPGRTYITDVTALGFAKSYDYHIRIDQVCLETKRIETSEWGKGIHHWLHTIHVLPNSNGSIWIDRISINAGLTTPVLALFARHMYRHRHKKRGAIELSASLGRSRRLSARGTPIYHPTEN
ncbi:hypothetical protein ACEWPM_019320 [Roseovarius sp. S4756]|uniref:hypothetical protein n=1 Tax=Roseovarius maritimus TaxID=3342637 RepID=UPI0037277BEF